LEEAKYFQIPRLEKWLKDRAYLRAVKVAHLVIKVKDLEDIMESTGANVVLEYYPTWST
jgi:BTB/POZ domain-containing protein KCTD9